MTAQEILQEYVEECARLARSGQAKAEESYYPAVNRLLTSLGGLSDPQRTTIPHPVAKEENHPDVGIYEKTSLVLVLPVEVKSTSVGESALLNLRQGRDYAKTFGGGHVLLTNLWQYIWAELDDSGNLVEQGRVSVVADPSVFMQSNPGAENGAGQGLTELLELACSVRSVVEDVDRVATLLAYHAKRMAEAIHAAGEPPQKLLRPVAESMEKGLGMNLEDEFFVPTIVQTLVYGLFAAWLDADAPQAFDRRRAVDAIPVQVIAELFHQILTPEFTKKCDLAPFLDATARTLQWVDRPVFEEQFDDYAIEYFYEPFLAKFDPDLRDRLGVWYTPREIAEYQVRRIDRHLRDDLGLEGGLADDSVIVLDPAVGTGTYLVAVTDHIYTYHRDNREPKQAAANKTAQAVLRRLIGFDVLPAAFLIAHLHIRRHLAQLGAVVPEDERLKVYLTNSLLGWRSEEGEATPLPLPGLEKEITAAAEVKGKEPVLAILGNPPYEGFSAAEKEEEKALLSDWIEPLWPDWDLRKHRLGDLYVRFWRIAVHKIADLTGRGVISFITNRKWLGGRSFPAMRDCIVHDFHRIVVDDLHGDVHDTSHPGDGSIFTTVTAAGIQRGVAISTLVREGEKPDGVAEVRRRDLRGTGEEKREKLTTFAGTDLDAGLDPHTPTKEKRWKLVPDTGGDDPGLDEYFQYFVSGVQPVREEAVADFNRGELEARMRIYFDREKSNEEVFEAYPGFNIERVGYEPGRTRKRLLGDSNFVPERIVPFLFKPLDGRWLYWEPLHELLNRARPELMPYHLRSTSNGYEYVEDQLAIVAAQTPRRPGAARPAVTIAVPGFHAVDPDARVLPRIRPPESLRGDAVAHAPSLGDGEEEYETNIAEEWIEAAREAGVPGSDLDIGDSIFYALIAVMNAPSWLDSIGTDVDDFPGVPLPGDPADLRRAASIGRRLAALYDPYTSVGGVTRGKISSTLARIAIPDAPRDRRLTAGGKQRGGSYVEENGGAILWNDELGWRNVSEEVWEFGIGGFQVLPKWLGYRHYSRDGYTLTDADFETVTNICRRISCVLSLQKNCEQAHQDALANPLEA